MFWFRRKEIVVDCFTYHHSVYEYYKPEKASNFIPDGWKKLAKTVDLKLFNDSNLRLSAPTSKSCLGFTNLYKRGFILQNHVEVSLEATDAGGLNVSSSDKSVTNIDQHDPYQVWDDFYKDYSHVKMTPPWSFVEKTGCNFLFTKCTWNDTDVSDKFLVLNGVVNYKIQHNAAVNFYVKKNSILTLNPGQPLAHIIPLSESKVKLKHHLISKEEYFNRFSFVPANNPYSEFERVKTKKECPFGFGK